ncbi:MAG: tRNA pseudouridine(38-40) synthase TruA [Clostridia bacterium]|nr:tRNA pseudouridine(38-40) synthase TruA [Clostridia bacterium]
MNIAIILSYDGTAYHGWQTQRNAISVQQTVTEAIAALLGQEVSVSGVGRTDAGVHARRYVANFHADCTIPMDRLPLAINSHLPMDIAVSGAAVVPDSFDARFSCTRKEYTYLICPGKIRDPFAVSRSYFYPYPLDVGAMQRAAQYFIGRQDFAAVRSMGTPVKSTVREIFTCSADTVGSYVRIRVSADGFLYNMVRAISGTLLYAGQGKFPPEDIPRILASCDREQAGPTLPPQGLYMSRLWYDDTPALEPFQLTREWNVSGGLL